MSPFGMSRPEHTLFPYAPTGFVSPRHLTSVFADRCHQPMRDDPQLFVAHDLHRTRIVGQRFVEGHFFGGQTVFRFLRRSLAIRISSSITCKASTTRLWQLGHGRGQPFAKLPVPLQIGRAMLHYGLALARPAFRSSLGINLQKLCYTGSRLFRVRCLISPESSFFSAPRDNTARASCGNGAKRKLLSLTLLHRLQIVPGPLFDFTREQFF
jgi:hypothetical protein